MELNGIANIKILTDTIRYYMEQNAMLEPHPPVKGYLARIDEQVDLMNRYMTEVGRRLNEAGVEVPYWHEVRDNKDKYPRNGD